MIVKIKKTRDRDCIDKISGKPCDHDGEVCECLVYSGNLTFPNKFEAS